MAQMFMVRHGQASFGEDDYDKLSALGHQQSALLGEYFTQREQHFDLVITGDMLRHKQTADGILNINSNANVMTDARWNEFDFDAIVKAYLRRFPEHQPGPKSPRSEWYKVLKNAMLCWSQQKLDLPNSETWLDFCGRVKHGCEFIQQSEYKKVLVVSSGGAMAVFLMNIFKSSVEQAIAFNLQIKNTSVNQLYFNKAGFQLNSFNNVPHLDTHTHLSKITYS